MQWLGTSALKSALVRTYGTRPSSGRPAAGSKESSRPRKVVKFYQRQSKKAIKPLPVVTATKASPSLAVVKTGVDLDTETLVSNEYSTRIVRKDENEMRIDRWLRTHFPTLTQSFIEKLLRKKQIAWADSSAAVAEGKWQRVASNHRVTLGSVVRIPSSVSGETSRPPSPKEKAISQEDTKLAKSWIIYEDDAMIVLNKPADLAVQGGTGIKESLAKYLPALMKPDAETLPMLVHRLDQHASGILVLARTKDAARKLSKAWEKHEIRKLYWAVTIGVPKKLAGNLKTKMIRVSDTSGVKVSLLKEDKPSRSKGKKYGRQQAPEDEMAPSITSKMSSEEVKVGISNYHTLSHSGDLVSLLALRPRTGRTHQLRVHCSEALQTPILGDYKYGSGITAQLKQMIEVVSPIKKSETGKPSKSTRSSEEKPQKLHLHARELALRHPTTNKLLHFVAPLPVHFKDTIRGFGLDIDNNSPESHFATLEASERRLEEKKASWLGDQRAGSEKVKKRLRSKMSQTKEKAKQAHQKRKRNSLKIIGQAHSTLSRALRRSR